MGRLFSALNAVFLGMVAVVGVFFNIEQRRMDNYQALYQLIQDRPDSEWSLDQEAVDAFSNSADCADVAFDPGAGGFRSGMFAFRCPLTDQHRFILNRLVLEKQERDRSTAVAAYSAPAPMREGPAASPGAGRQLAPRRVPETISATQRRSLISDLNSSNRDTRRSVTAEIEARYLSDASVVAGLIEEIADEARLEALSAQGRYNVLYLLNQVPDRVWTQDMLQRARQAITLIRERGDSGKAAMGDQTKQALMELDAKIRRLGA